MAISVIFIPFASPVFELNYHFLDPGSFDRADGSTFSFHTFNSRSAVSVSKESAPLFTQSFYLVLQYLIGLFFLFQLKDLINSISEHKSFQLMNYKRLKYMGFALITHALIKVIHFFTVYQYLGEAISHPAIEVDTSFSPIQDFGWYPFLFGFILIILAEAFREGFLLKQEQTLTI